MTVIRESDRFDFVVPHEHPSLTGHFPGNPVVPGVVILQHVAEAAQELGFTVNAITNVKFSAILLAGEKASIEFTKKGGGLLFTITCNDDAIANGSLGVTPVA